MKHPPALPTTLAKPTPLYRQICASFEAQILSGELAAGARIPPTTQLAQRFGVTVQTVQQGVTLLRRRGLIERIPGRGTFVTHRIATRTAGLVFGTNVFGKPHQLYYQLLYGLLCKELKRHGWGTSLFFPADDESIDQFLAELNQEAGAGHLHGLIVHHRNPPLQRWLNDECRIPQVSDPNAPEFQPPGESDAYRGLDYLLARGYRRIALIQHAPGIAHRLTHTHQAIALAYAAHGLPPTATLYAGDAVTAADGAAWARTALAQPEGRPEALLVLNDVACSGVIFELLCQRLRLPRDLALLSTSNQGIELQSPVPLTRLEADPAGYARAVVEHLLGQLAGVATPQPHLLSHLVIGKSCGE